MPNLRRHVEKEARRKERKALRADLQAYVDSYNGARGWRILSRTRTPGFKSTQGPPLPRGLRRLIRRPYLTRS